MSLPPVAGWSGSYLMLPRASEQNRTRTEIRVLFYFHQLTARLNDLLQKPFRFCRRPVWHCEALSPAGWAL